MARIILENQRTPNEKQVEKRIDLENEEIRFTQVFFLPLATGLVALYYTTEPIQIKIVLQTIGVVGLIFLYSRREHSIKKIKELIDNL